MDRKQERHDAETDHELPNAESQDDPAAELTARQRAAAYLRAARLTDDAREREALRQKAAELLSPRRGTRSSPVKKP